MMKQLTMCKARSPHLITFSPDPDDSHFVNVRIIRKTTGEVKRRHYILSSDVPQWVGIYESDGFEIVV